ncbi:tripartite tricarboxylate transporter substrate-binding protein [Citricoccus sp. GCM10030269]|uniref:tripartite tricarboxylate transporter substrate-binding protein n=1 Tax=Citricoccus sp. GCM10030269 TaxID=3273388 RepID=UPI0036133860
MNRKVLTSVSALSASALLLTGCGQSSGGGTNDDGTWSPEGTVEIAVGAQPGGGSDILGRAFAEAVEEHTGDSTVVENYDTVEGVLIVKDEPGKGDIVGVGNYSNMVVRPNEQDVGYTWKDYTQLALVAEDVSYVVAKSGAFDSAEQMVEQAKGEGLTVAQVGSGAADSLLTRQLSDSLGMTLDPVVYEGGGDSIRGVLSGDVDLAVLEAAEFLPQVEAGELEVMLSTGDEPAEHPELADVPLASDLGADQRFSTQWRIIFGAPDLDQAQKDYWLDNIEAWTESPAYDQYIEENALSPEFLTGDELTTFIEESEQDLLENME